MMLHPTLEGRWNIVHFFVAVIAVELTLLMFRGLRYLRNTWIIRSSWGRIPAAPRSFWSGNLNNLALMLHTDKHPDYGFYAMWTSFNRPKWFLLDLWPRQAPLICIADPEVAEQLTRATPEYPASTPKMATPESLQALVGKTSVSTTNGDDWKNVRQKLNPVFQPKAILSTISSITSHTETFVTRLRSAAGRNAVIPLGDYFADLATDVIGTCIIGHDLMAQQSAENEGEKGPEGILTSIRGIVELQVPHFASWWQRLLAGPILRRKMSALEKKLDSRLASLIRDQQQAGPGDSLAPSFISKLPLGTCVDQYKTLIFAGQDTTACSLQWCFFHLQKREHADVLSKLRAEHEAVFGQENVANMIRDHPDILLQRLPYTTAVIKETLRLSGISGTTRELDKDMWVEVNGEKVKVEKGAICYINNFLLMKNPEYWGADAETFRPGRFLDERSKRLRAAAYRPFERGPRACVGQELAMLEMRVVLVLTVRRFNFVKVGFDGISEEEVYDISRVLHSPVDRMRMRFTERENVRERGEKVD